MCRRSRATLDFLCISGDLALNMRSLKSSETLDDPGPTNKSVRFHRKKKNIFFTILKTLVIVTMTFQSLIIFPSTKWRRNVHKNRTQSCLPAGNNNLSLTEDVDFPHAHGMVLA